MGTLRGGVSGSLLHLTPARIHRLTRTLLSASIRITGNSELESEDHIVTASGKKVGSGKPGLGFEFPASFGLQGGCVFLFSRLGL